MKNLIKSSPLPFQGQKRNMFPLFIDALKGFDPRGTYVDAFGGSGLLSNCVKTIYPEARVIWNDYDNYAPEYLKGVERVSADYATLLEKHPKTIPVLDPPYLSTDCANYEGHWGLVESLAVLDYCKKEAILHKFQKQNSAFTKLDEA